MRAGIYTNLKKDVDLTVTKQLFDLLNKHKFELFLHEDITVLDSTLPVFTNDGSLNADVLFALGGDGTILKVAKLCAKSEIPILGINIGTIGFMSEILPSELDVAIEKLKSGAYTVEKRSMVTTTVQNRQIDALNDIVVNRMGNGKLALINLFIDGQVVDRYHCDGFIVSTPTGSTAYSLSAGGAIVSPLADVLALTPINSHTLHSRPLVVADNESVSLSFGNTTPVCVIADGKVVAENVLEDIHISKSNLTVPFIRFHKQNFYHRLLGKLNKWSVADLEELS